MYFKSCKFLNRVVILKKTKIFDNTVHRLGFNKQQNPEKVLKMHVFIDLVLAEKYAQYVPILIWLTQNV